MLNDVLYQIITIVKTTSLSVTEVGVAGWAWSTHATVSTSQEQTLSGRGARVYTCTCAHGASILTTSPRQECLALKGLHTGAGWAW